MTRDDYGRNSFDRRRIDRRLCERELGVDGDQLSSRQQRGESRR